MKNPETKKIKFRYLLWFYKDVKESVDLVERKFTQLEVDNRVLNFLIKKTDNLPAQEKDKSAKYLKEFNDYIEKKEKDGKRLKFEGAHIKPEYQFLLLKLESIEEAIFEELGQEGLDRIKTLYEEEMQKRILASREH